MNKSPLSKALVASNQSTFGTAVHLPILGLINCAGANLAIRVLCMDDDTLSGRKSVDYQGELFDGVLGPGGEAVRQFRGTSIGG